MDDPDLQAKEELIQLIFKSYNEQDILSMSRNLGIDYADFYVKEAIFKENCK